jgi:hypothetical protein
VCSSDLKAVVGAVDLAVDVTARPLTAEALEARKVRALERIARALEVATGTAPKRTPRTPAAPSRQPTELDRARAVRALRRHGIAE